jgi:hypothetical protein
MPESPSEKNTIVPSASAPSSTVATIDRPAPSPSTSQTTNQTANEDPRDRVTPDAFFVAPELLGRPLAKPAARGWAWVIDGVAVGMLSQAGPFLLAVALALLSYQLVSKRKLNKVGNGVVNAVQSRAGKLPLIMTAVFIGWAAMIGIDWLTAEKPNKEAAEPIIAAEIAAEAANNNKTPEELELTALRAENRKLKEDGGGFSLLETGRRLLDDIGFGFGWAAVYFSLLTSWWQGQTLGKKLLGLRVVQLNGKPLSVWDSFNRYGGYAAGFATGLLGFAQVLWDANRQAIHDKISFTVVLDEKRG